MKEHPIIFSTDMHIIIYVEPVGKARPRFGISKHGTKYAYTTSKTAHTENLIRDRVMELKEFYPQNIPLKLRAIFYRTRPKTLPKKVTLPTSRPDWDNYGKLLCDALEKFVYDNDSQITTAIIRKRFGNPPRIELELKVDNIEIRKEDK